MPTTQEIIQRSNEEVRVSREKARDPSTPADELARLSNHLEKGVVVEVARNPSTPRSVIAALFKNADIAIAASIAGNPSSPADILEQLVNHEDYVRLSLASNPSTPLSVLSKLTQDDSSYVAERVLKNPSITAEIKKEYTTRKLLKLLDGSGISYEEAADILGKKVRI